MRLGFFSRLLDRVDAGERYRLAAEQVAAAERADFDSAWIAQHHFNENEGGLPAPLPFLAYLAAVTRRIRLGTGVITLPMESPVRVAEDTAVVDLLANGRLEIGFGTGNSPAAYTAFGLDHADRGELYEKALATVRNAWAGDKLPGGDTLYPTAPTLADRVWQASFSVAGAIRAGQAGDGLMLSRSQPRPPTQPDAKLHDLQIPIVEAYKQALPPGRAPRIMLSRSVFVADDRSEALRLAEAGLSRANQILALAGKPVKNDTLDDLLRGFDAHVGTPNDVIASLSADATLPHATDLVVQVHSIDPPHEHILRSIELTASTVAPALGWLGGRARKNVIPSSTARNAGGTTS